MKDALYSASELVAVYDQINSGRADFDFYITHIPDRPQHILDIGCGTGTFTIELGVSGHQVTGLEPAQAMLDIAASKPDAHKVAWLCGDSRSLDMRDHFDLAFMTGHTFQCLLTDEQIADLFKDVATSLKPGGSFLFETRNPIMKPWEKWTLEHARPPVPLKDGNTVQVIHEIVEIGAETVSFQETYHFPELKQKTRSTSTLRFAAPTHICRLAEQAGLNATILAGDWRGNAFDPETSPEIIFRLSRPAA